MAETLETARLLLRRPVASDAEPIFHRYASDPAVTRYLAWPRHTSIADTHAFLAFSDAAWGRWPTGPLLLFTKGDGVLIGGSGLGFESAQHAVTGYVLTQDAWGRGYATETLAAMVALAASVGARRISAICHVDHRPSWRVMEKCGLVREGVLEKHTVFPNLSPEPLDVLQYGLRLAP